MSELERRAWSPQGKELRAVGCNLCGSARARWLARENGLDVVRCRECGLVYVTPQPSQRELERFYADYYPAGSEARWRELTAPVFACDARRLAAALPGRGRVLDVGTGFGHFLEALRAEGFDAEGLESSPLARERLAARGLRAHAGMMPDDVVLPAESYDAITASMVLEHVANPIGFLRRARDLLRPGGLLFVRVPNFALLRAFLFAGRLSVVPGVRAAMRIVRRETMDEATLFHVVGPPGHLHGFEPRTLAAALAGAGFERVRLEGDPMAARGSRLNRVIDGSAYAAARALRSVSRGRLELSPVLSAWAWKARGAVDPPGESCAIDADASHLAPLRDAARGDRRAFAVEDADDAHPGGAPRTAEPPASTGAKPATALAKLVSVPSTSPLGSATSVSAPLGRRARGRPQEGGGE